MYKVPSVFRHPSTFLHCGSLIEASGREAWGRLEKVGAAPGCHVGVGEGWGGGQPDVARHRPPSQFI